MEEECILYLKPANIYRYCGPWCSYPITKAEAEKRITSWVLNDGYEIEIWEKTFVKGYSPKKPE